METETLTQLEDLASRLDVLKRNEEVCRSARIKTEEAIAELIPGPDKGQKTVTLPDESRLVVERGLIYKADVEAIRKLAVEVECHPPIKPKTTWTLDEIGYEWYRKNHPGAFSAFSRCVEVKPKKTAITYKKKK